MHAILLLLFFESNLTELLAESNVPEKNGVFVSSVTAAFTASFCEAHCMYNLHFHCSKNFLIFCVGSKYALVGQALFTCEPMSSFIAKCSIRMKYDYEEWLNFEEKEKKKVVEGSGGKRGSMFMCLCISSFFETFARSSKRALVKGRAAWKRQDRCLFLQFTWFFDSIHSVGIRYYI